MRFSFRQIVLAPAVALLGLTLLPQSAFACREYMFPTQLREPADVVVVVEVTESAFQGDQSRFYVWGATAAVQRAIVGVPDSKTFEFGGAWQSTGCRRTREPPAPGEIWVLYLQSGGEKLSVVESLPIEVAARIDPRVAASGAAPKPN